MANSERGSFILQNMAYYTTKGGLLLCKRPPFVCCCVTDSYDVSKRTLVRMMFLLCMNKISAHVVATY